MKVEIRENDSSMVYDIGPGGAVLGRERARTDISFSDESISKRHARIFVRDGAWFLEDLGSSNGTYVDSLRITQPHPLSEGLAFSLAQKRFEVVRIDVTVAASSALGASPLSVPPPQNGSKNAFGSASISSRPLPGYDGGSDGLNPLPTADLVHASGSLGSGGARAGGPDDDKIVSKGVGAVMGTLPKAIAYYLVAVPKMALNPIGTTRRAIQEQTFPPTGGFELAAYALPPFAVVFLCALFGQFVAGIVGGSGIGSVFGSLIKGLLLGAVEAVIAGLVAAFVAHPLLKWVVSALRGRSTARSRTNAFLMGWTVQILLALPAAIAPIVAALHVPFLDVIPLLIGFVSAAVLLVVLFLWARAFDVVSWFRYAILAVGALYAVFTAIGLVRTIVGGIDRVLSGTPAVPAAAQVAGQEAGAALPEVLERQRQALNARMAAGEISQAEFDAQVAALIEAAKGKAAVTDSNVGSSNSGASNSGASNSGASNSGASNSGASNSGASNSGASNSGASNSGASNSGASNSGASNSGAPNSGASNSSGVSSPSTDNAPNEGGSKTGPAVTGSALSGATENTGSESTTSKAGAPASDVPPPIDPSTAASNYAEFAEKRKAIEEALESNPRLMRDPDIQSEYRKLWNILNQRNKYWAKKRKKTKADERVNARLKDADIFDRAHKNVDRLYKKIFSR